MQSLPRILVVGSANIDLVLQMDKVPERGENLVGSAYSYVEGGKGANQAVAAARAGAQVAFVGCVGTDHHGDMLVASLEREGVSTRFVTRSAQPTGLAVVLVEASGQNRIVVYPGANGALRADDVSRAFGYQWDAVLVQLEIPDEAVAETVRRSRAEGIPVVVDAGPARPIDVGVVRGCDVITPNQSETTALTGLPCATVEEAEIAARRLWEQVEVRVVIIKMGARGALLYAEGHATHVPAFPVRAIDPTAAGDAFTAAMTVAWLSSRDWIHAVRVGNAAGALAVMRLGAQPSLPSADEIARFLAEH